MIQDPEPTEDDPDERIPRENQSLLAYLSMSLQLDNEVERQGKASQLHPGHPGNLAYVHIIHVLMLHDATIYCVTYENSHIEKLGRLASHANYSLPVPLCLPCRACPGQDDSQR